MNITSPRYYSVLVITKTITFSGEPFVLLLVLDRANRYDNLWMYLYLVKMESKMC